MRKTMGIFAAVVWTTCLSISAIAAEPAACPTLTRGKYAYDFGDTSHLTPLVKMYTLVHGFMPAPIHAGPEDPTIGDVTVPPPSRGTRIRINEFLPGHLDAQGLQSPIHRTESIDYGIVLEGEITLLLDDSEVTAHAGDIVVQRGTDHAWANRGDGIARVVFVLVDGEYQDDVLRVLPEDVRDGLMRHGPRD